jgi:hypothetical protein
VRAKNADIRYCGPLANVTAKVAVSTSILCVLGDSHARGTGDDRAGTLISRFAKGNEAVPVAKHLIAMGVRRIHRD